MNRETELLKKLGQHPNVITLKQHFYSKRQARIEGADSPVQVAAPDNRKYLNLVTEFMPLTLAKFNQISRVDETKMCEASRVQQIKQLMRQMFAGLVHIHRAGIAHRDLKPDNILIDNGSLQLKICDFGSAKLLLHHNDDRLNNTRGSVTYISTRYYRAPELMYGNHHYGIEIDLWAAGCVLAEMFTISKPKHNNKEQRSCNLFRGDNNVH